MELDYKELFELSESEQQQVNNIFAKWKEKNQTIESEIDKFMDNKKEHIKEIIERSDKLQSIDGVVKAVGTTKPSDKQENEEIRLLKEQNELLRQLLAKQMS